MRKRDTVIVTVGFVAIAALILLFLSNIFVYLPLKSLFGGPAETTSAETEILCEQSNCILTIKPSVFGPQQNVTSIAVYGGTHRLPPSGEPLAVISRPSDRTWNDETVSVSLPKRPSYTIVAMQSYEPEIQGVARVPSALYRPLFGEPRRAVVIETVKGPA